MIRAHTILFTLVLLFAASFRLAVLNRPFERNPEGCGAFYGLMARNYFRYDLSQSHGLPVISMGQGASPVFYANHPPTTTLLIALVHLLTGYGGEYDHLPGEWQTRLPAAVFTIACIALIYRLLRKRASERAALIAAALFAAIPMTLYYGGLPDVINPQLVFFALLTVAAYERFHDQPDARRFALLLLAFTGAGIMDWPAFFLVPVLGLHYVCTRPPRQWGWIIGFGLASVVIFAALYAHLAWGQSNWRWMIQHVERRAGSGQTDTAHRFTLAEWMRHAIWEICVARHTLIVCLIALLWVIVAVSRRFAHPADRFAGLVLAWGALHVVMGRQGVYQHEWWWWPVTPGLVIAAGLMIDHFLLTVQDRLRISSRVANVSIGVLLAIFAGGNVRVVLREMDQPKRINKSGYEYSLVEFGQIIRANVPPDAAAIVAESDQSLGLWYYADRPLKRQVWESTTFQKRLTDGIVDLSFDAYAPWNGPVVAMIVPKPYVKSLVPPFADQLDTQFERHDLGNFLLYDLRKSKRAIE